MSDRSYARVLVLLPFRSRQAALFDYHVPPELLAHIQPGVLVVVPFRHRELAGVIIERVTAPAVPETKPIRRVLDPQPLLTPALLDLARWMARETLTPLQTCVRTMIPAGLRPRDDQLLTPQQEALPDGLPETAEVLYRLLLERGPLRTEQVAQAAALRGHDWRRALVYLRKQELVAVTPILKLPKLRPQTADMVSLAKSSAHWEAGLEKLRLLEIYEGVLRFLAEEEEPVDVSVVYAETGAERTHLKMLEKRGLVTFAQREVVRDPVAELIYTPLQAPELLPDQQVVWEQVARLLEPGPRPPAPVLLLGVTGSGKTELYLRATERVLAQGRQALILVPEISLTPQTVRRFALRFPGKVGVWHSGLRHGERFDTWRRVRSGELSVLVGARSALFAPFPDLGLIVLDEEEDSSYKQGRRPFYHARETAEALAKRTNALLILGSATPTLEAYAHAQAGRYRLLEMPRRILGHARRLDDWRRKLRLPALRYAPAEEGSAAWSIALPPVQIVDMRAELQAGNRSIFSRALQTAVDAALARGEQTILFLNRRGTATYVFCRDCGWVAMCPQCDIPLTFHAGTRALVCHRCNARTSSAARCPACGSAHVRHFGLGTSGLEARVAERWPRARLLRWDRDIASSHAAHAQLMGRFVRGEADIVVGTQMIARGLDLPGVTVVGVISADTALNLPDFRAAERTFQLLTQVAGRAGRGLLGGHAVVQTYHPDHYAIRCAATHDYQGFAAQELAARQRLGYPPLMRMARLVYQHPSDRRAQAQAEALARTLRRALAEAELPPSDLIGPAPAFMARVRGRYRWQLLLRHLDPAAFLRPLTIPAGWRVDIDPVDVL